MGAPSNPDYIARQIYEWFGLDARDAGAFRVLVDALLEEGVVRLVPAGELPCDAVLQRNLWGQWEILVRARMPLARRDFAVAHELAEWWLSEDNYRETDVEELADHIARALLEVTVPRRSVIGSGRSTPQ